MLHNVPSTLTARSELEPAIFADAAPAAARPLRIAILNLMPTKEVTETQFLRLLGRTAQPVEVTFLRTATHESKNASATYLAAHYKTLADVKDDKFDGFLMTGAPVELMEFEAVNYWQELREIMDWADRSAKGSLYICWGVQAALHHFHRVP